MGDKFELLKTPVNRTAVRKKNKNEKLRLRVIFLDDSERVFEVEVRNHIYIQSGASCHKGLTIRFTNACLYSSGFRKCQVEASCHMHIYLLPKYVW